MISAYQKNVPIHNFEESAVKGHELTSGIKGFEKLFVEEHFVEEQEE